MTDKQSQNKIAKLQMMEQRLHSYILQKQNYQSQILEIDNALTESSDSNEVYRVVGQMMIKVDKDKLTKELKDKKELMDKRVKDIEGKEEKLREEMLPLQQEVMKSFKNDE